ncbi:hypothetical protein KAR91_33675 [Candidatus Pacearchaeota archaeon]|nr:hypothetical protein [Candidatus Pacearchaeota archaeon]
MTKVIDTRTKKLNPVIVHELPASGPIGDLSDNIEIVDGPNWEDKAALLAFMEEYVMVMIQSSGHVNEEQYVETRNDGVLQMIERGVWQKVKRKFVEVLARAKPNKITTPKFIDSTGANSVKVIKTPSLKYLFEMRDNNPLGQPWLEGILQEA